MYLKNQFFIYRSTTPMHTECVIMGENYYQDYTKAPTMMSAPNEVAGFEVSDFFEFNDWIMNEEDPMFSGYDNNHPQINPMTNHTEVYSSGISCSSNLHERTSCNNRESGIGKKETKEKVAFKTKSEIEVLDDGFKWRKYGKKMVKNSPNPRNYYRCSVEGCTVKKRVERDTEDPRYVVTTYEGIHNHQGPQM